MSRTLLIKPTQVYLSKTQENLLAHPNLVLIARLGSQVGRTKAWTGDKFEATWSDEITLIQTNEQSLELRLSAMETSSSSVGQLLGVALIPTSLINSTAPFSKWFPLMNKEQESGQVFVSISSSPSPSAKFSATSTPAAYTSTNYSSTITSNNNNNNNNTINNYSSTSSFIPSATLASQFIQSTYQQQQPQPSFTSTRYQSPPKIVTDYTNTIKIAPPSSVNLSTRSLSQNALRPSQQLQPQTQQSQLQQSKNLQQQQSYQPKPLNAQLPQSVVQPQPQQKQSSTTQERELDIVAGLLGSTVGPSTTSTAPQSSVRPPNLKQQQPVPHQQFQQTIPGFSSVIQPNNPRQQIHSVSLTPASGFPQNGVGSAYQSTRGNSPPRATQFSGFLQPSFVGQDNTNQRSILRASSATQLPRQPSTQYNSVANKDEQQIVDGLTKTFDNQFNLKESTTIKNPMKESTSLGQSSRQQIPVQQSQYFSTTSQAQPFPQQMGTISYQQPPQFFGQPTVVLVPIQQSQQTSQFQQSVDGSLQQFQPVTFPAGQVIYAQQPQVQYVVQPVQTLQPYQIINVPPSFAKNQ